MKKILTLIILNCFISLFQTAFFPELFGKYIYINLVFVFGISWLLIGAPLTAYKSVFIGGILLDMLTSSRLGLSPLLFTIFVFILVTARKHLFRGLIPFVLLSTIFGYVYSIIIYKVGFTLDINLLFYAFLTACLSILISFILRQVLVARK